MSMEKPIVSQGKPLDKLKIYETLFIFMENVLTCYEPSVHEKGEDKITQDIEISVNEATRTNDTLFAFQNQHKEKGNYTSDIGVYLRSTKKNFCSIEAKRLPIPKSYDRDEREYVIVDKTRFKGNGGIQRFKEGNHAPDFSYSIMIGYIQDENNSDYWLFKINTWIAELANTDNGFWDNEDILDRYDSKKCERFISMHKRRDETTITLHHYWIKL